MLIPCAAIDHNLWVYRKVVITTYRGSSGATLARIPKGEEPLGRGANAVRVGAAPPLRRRRKKASEPKPQVIPKNRKPTVRLNRRYPKLPINKGQSNSPAQSTVNRRIADLISRNSEAYFVKPQTRRQAGKNATDLQTPPPALRQVWWLCKNRVRSFAQLNRRYVLFTGRWLDLVVSALTARFS